VNGAPTVLLLLCGQWAASLALLAGLAGATAEMWEVVAGALTLDVLAAGWALSNGIGAGARTRLAGLGYLLPGNYSLGPATLTAAHTNAQCCAMSALCVGTALALPCLLAAAGCDPSSLAPLAIRSVDRALHTNSPSPHTHSTRAIANRSCCAVAE
jgi:hypothetical protein